VAAPDPAHAPRPGEGTGPLPSVATSSPAPYSTGPLPALPEGAPDNPFIQALRRNLPAINGGRKSLRAGLADIIVALLTEFASDEVLTTETGESVITEVPDLILQHWLAQVAAERITFEGFLGAIVADGYLTALRKSLTMTARLSQAAAGANPDMPSALTVLNLLNQFDATLEDAKVHLAEMVANKVTDHLKGGLDAQTANQLTQLLQSSAK
jgi:hypothetical protein